MNRLFFIVNPVSGSGRAEAEFQKVAALLDARGVPYEAVRTERPRHATQLARLAVERGEPLVVAVGGDGTVNEVASALIGTETALCVLPFGTGNDFTKVMGFPAEPEKAVEALLHGEVRHADACEANDLHFINVAGFGFDADVLAKTQKYKKRFHGMASYLLGIFDALSHLRTLRMTIEHDGLVEKANGIIFSVGNGQYIGGGMRAVPMGDPFDGYIDVCYVERVSVFQFLTLLPRFIKGKHITLPMVHHFRTKEVRVLCEEESMLNLDGELDSATPVTFRVLPGALRVLLPEGGVG